MHIQLYMDLYKLRCTFVATLVLNKMPVIVRIHVYFKTAMSSEQFSAIQIVNCFANLLEYRFTKVISKNSKYR